MNKYAIIVDPFSTGRLYPPLFKNKGVQSIAVISNPNLPKHIIKDLIHSNFSSVIYWDNHKLAELKSLEVVCVVPGCETGVELADQLAKELGVNGNNVSSSGVRRHKYYMQMALKQAGLRNIASTLLKSQDEIPALISSLLPNQDYVVKPANSSGADGVIFASGPKGVETALNHCKWDQKNGLGEVNAGFLVQEFIRGPEYVVDMVGFSGQYVIASVCRYKKIPRNGAQFIYDSLDVVDPYDPSFAPLITYAQQAASALEINVGAVHMEIIWAESGPVMVEAGARLHGGVAPELFNETYSPNLLDLAVGSYLNPSGQPPENSKLIKSGKIGFFYSDGQIFKRPEPVIESQVKSMNGYLGHRYFVASDTPTPPTIDLATCPGLFWLAHQDNNELQHVAENVRQMLWPL